MLVLIILVCCFVLMIITAHKNKKKQQLYEAIDKEYALIRSEKQQEYEAALECFTLNDEATPLVPQNGLPHSSFYPDLFTVYCHNGSEVYHQHLSCKTLKHLPRERHLFECIDRKRPCRICSHAPPREIDSLYQSYIESREYASQTATERFSKEYCSDNDIPWLIRKTQSLAASAFIAGICVLYLFFQVLPPMLITSVAETHVAAPSTTHSQTHTYTPTEKTFQAPAVDPQSNYVYVSRTGECYHSRAGCSNMKSPMYISIDEAKNMGRRPCSKCY